MRSANTLVNTADMNVPKADPAHNPMNIPRPASAKSHRHSTKKKMYRPT